MYLDILNNTMNTNIGNLYGGGNDSSESGSEPDISPAAFASNDFSDAFPTTTGIDPFRGKSALSGGSALSVGTEEEDLKGWSDGSEDSSSVRGGGNRTNGLADIIPEVEEVNFAGEDDDEEEGIPVVESVELGILSDIPEGKEKKKKSKKDKKKKKKKKKNKDKDLPYGDDDNDDDDIDNGTLGTAENEALTKKLSSMFAGDLWSVNASGHGGSVHQGDDEDSVEEASATANVVEEEEQDWGAGEEEEDPKKKKKKTKKKGRGVFRWRTGEDLEPVDSARIDAGDNDEASEGSGGDDRKEKKRKKKDKKKKKDRSAAVVEEGGEGSQNDLPDLSEPNFEDVEDVEPLPPIPAFDFGKKNKGGDAFPVGDVFPDHANDSARNEALTVDEDLFGDDTDSRSSNPEEYDRGESSNRDDDDDRDDDDEDSNRDDKSDRDSDDSDNPELELSDKDDDSDDRSSNDDEESFADEYDEEEGRGRGMDDESDAKDSDDEGDDDEDDEELPPAMGGGATLDVSLLCRILFLFSVVVVGSSIGTAYYGTKLLLEKEGIAPPPGGGIPSTPAPFPTMPIPPPSPAPSSSPAPSTTPSPTTTLAPTVFEPDLTVKCPPNNVPLEFVIVFDRNPSDIGVFLRDSVNTVMWGFEENSFRSIAQLLRENYFIVCVPPRQEYRFEVTDRAGNGLVSNFLGSNIYGSFRLSYDNFVLAEYNGDCDGFEGPSTLCGDFCACDFTLTESGGAGGCSTNCTVA